jgi:hypothetical protein
MLIDPTVDNSSRTRFRIPNGTYASSLKLIDVGVYDAQQTIDTGLFYPSINGVLGAIRRLTLYSGDVVLSTCEELRAYGAIQNLRTSNQGSEDRNRFELLNGINSAISAGEYEDPTALSGALTLNPRLKDYTNSWTANGRSYLHNQIKISSASSEQSGQLLLSNYLEFLASTPTLQGIPDLQVEIEWDITNTNFTQDADAPTAVATPAYTHMRPTLIVDEIVGAPTVTSVKIPYMQTILERFVVPATTNGTVQEVSFRSQAFKNRYVKDLTFFTQINTSDGWFNRNERSPSMYRERLQLVVNGSKYLPDQGINQEAMKLQYFNDTMGSLNLPLLSALQSLVDGSGNVISASDATNASSRSDKFIHNFSVTAVKIENVIDRLDIEYGRTGNNALGSAQAQVDNIAQFNLLCFGRVAKMLEVRNGKIIDSY